MVITEITLDPQKVVPGDPLRFRVGEPAVEGGYVVDRIRYCPETRVFNKGLEIGQGCYAVYLNNVDNRRLVSEEVVTTVDVVKETKSTAEADVNLPE